MKNPRQMTKQAIRVLVLTLVVLGIYHSVRKSIAQLASQRTLLTENAQNLRVRADSADPETASALREQADDLLMQADDFWKPNPLWLLAAAVFYGIGMFPASLFWHRCLNALDQRAPLSAVVWAYFYGGLGKYFPGKAMVVVLRVGTLLPFGVKKMATSITIFMETLTMMAVGGAVAGCCLIILQIDWRLTLLAIGLLTVTFLPTFPPLLRRLIPRLQSGVDEANLNQWTRRIHWKLIVQGWGLLALTWLAFGLSLLFVLEGLPSAEGVSPDLSRLLLSSLGACALAVVLGFVSLIPGGAGVREVVLSAVLAPVVGPVAALCCALWLRIVWLATELSIVGVFALIRMRTTEQVRMPDGRE